MEDLLLEEGGKGVTGVRTEAGEQLRAQCVVITTGTFLRGVVHIGRASRPAGRINGPGGLDSDGTEPPATALATTLARLSLPLGRLKTGTPPRLDARTIAWEDLEPQPSEQYPHVQLKPRTSRSAPDLLRTHPGSRCRRRPPLPFSYLNEGGSVAQARRRPRPAPPPPTSPSYGHAVRASAMP